MKRLFTLLAAAIAITLGAGAWHLHGKQPLRDGTLVLAGLQADVSVRYDERGVPHIEAQNEADMYRALGFVQAQDRLFQMEMLRRLARGELAEILGSRLVPTDRLFRSLEIRVRADADARAMDMQSPAAKALGAYLEGINQYQDSRPAPLEFDLLGIDKRPFTVQDTLSIAGYLAYSFAAALRSEPLMTYVRDELGADYLALFDLDWHPQGVLASRLAAADWQALDGLARLSQQALAQAGLPQYEGSNAWAISGSRTASGKPLLAGDPHIRFAVPSVWYEAHLRHPGFELYGHHQPATPVAFLGHNRDFAWSLTMFQNDDLDLIAEKTNPDNPEQVWHKDRWVDLQRREEIIRVKNADPVRLTLRRSPHGPIVNDALDNAAGSTPIAMWWAFLETENPLLEAFYELNRAASLGKARSAVQKIHAPGLNVVWANAGGDIGWWAAARLPRRPAGVNPAFILDGASGEADKPGFHPFSDNPQEENPARGYIVSANFQPLSPTGIEIPGYYNLPDRGQRLDERLAEAGVRWDLRNSQALQLETGTGYGPRLLAPILDELRAAAADERERELVERLAGWSGDHPLQSIAATLFNQLTYELSRAAMADELGEAFFEHLLSSRALDTALPRLTADSASPWWHDHASATPQSRAEVVAQAWRASMRHLRQALGEDPTAWRWGPAHTLTHPHPLGTQPPLDRLFNVGPLHAPGGHETPNNLSHRIATAPWQVVYGPSTRRLIDLADASHSLGINPVGQSGVPFDRHYSDQARRYIDGEYVPQHLSQEDVARHTRSTLILRPAD
ncbi:penicillin acylase family protein [Phytopseudomonas dryadis]|uniref:Penicillin acylase family protein n=1 Tax=Phytopseudomonas dryadis TaxID=2487520 RepID=A0A4Q9R0T4_9GAMM|nr:MULTISPECIES: penicillin acylase family protein [Pseudomonas]TBU92534.1 penicillin acylase family protein [Pseudomonas dryadis]TBV03052.1 penicillin acylase family protein [Pseudomonas dryadis]TBV17671.1 penicillin acylase family protein [Pseudomonas sp. FRB 230]